MNTIIRRSIILLVALSVSMLTLLRFNTEATASADFIFRDSERGKAAAFDARHELKVTVPAGTRNIRLWFAIPQESDPSQKVSNMKIESPYPYAFRTDSEGNRFLFIEKANPAIGDFTVATTFRIERLEIRKPINMAMTRPLTDHELLMLSDYLKPNTHVVINERMTKQAQEIVGDEQNAIIAARKIYDWVLENIDYWVKSPDNKKASPVGSSEYCIDSGTGNCTDFHSLFMSLSRAVGIPTRIKYGSLFKTSLDSADQDQSYHCWLEFYTPELDWVPLDVSLADIFEGNFTLNDVNEMKVKLTTAIGYDGKSEDMVDYYFGNLDERRVTWAVGRDLILTPRQNGGPINALPKAYVEVDGKVHLEKTGWTRKLTYKQVK